MSKHHGIAYGIKHQEEGIEFYTCFTLFDITNTGVVMPFNSNLVSFIDSAEQPVYNEQSWERSRNQQRNWDTIVQAISMRAQPLVLQSPKIIEDNLSNYNFSNVYTGIAKIWTFKFGVEAKDVYRKNNDPVGLLTSDCHFTPLSTNLTESLTIFPECISTENQINTYFMYGYFN
jgi:hypothetical protein